MTPPPGTETGSLQIVPEVRPGFAHASVTDEEMRSFRPRWRQFYARRLVLSDLVVVIATMVGAQWFWLGGGNTQVPSSANSAFDPVSYWIVSAAIAFGWMLALALIDSRDYRTLGSGFDEYRRVFNASLVLAGVVSIFSYLAAFELARGYVLIAFPVGTLLLLVTRFAWRQWLLRERKAGRSNARVLLVGSRYSVIDLNRDLSRRDDSGFKVVGACIVDGDGAAAFGSTPDYLPGSRVPVGGDPNDLGSSLDAIGADTVVIAGTDASSTQWLKEVGWSLDPERHFMVVAPGLLDIGGPRIVAKPVAGLPLLHIDSPKFTRTGLFAKRLMDILGSLLILLVLSPVMLGTALAVKFTSAGPVFYKQERYGYAGKTFLMWKFRSMRQDADAHLQRLLDENRDAGNSVQFKLKNDPRITPVGKFIRRFSIDELPQLFNVLGGSMSLIGPRPHQYLEVEQYEDHVHRRFLVKPGMTGLWQVSGRSNLSWEDSVRLDLYYVENWSIAADLVILARTARAVLGKDGAY